MYDHSKLDKIAEDAKELLESGMHDYNMKLKRKPIPSRRQNRYSKWIVEERKTYKKSPLKYDEDQRLPIIEPFGFTRTRKSY